MSTLLDIGTDALTSIGQLGIGQSPSAEQVAQVLRVSNRMLGKWSTSRFMLFVINTRPFVLVPGTQDYTVGPTGATFTGTRPTFVEAAQIVGPGSAMDLPMNILDKLKWGAIRDKGATCSADGLPQDVWPEYTNPNLAFHVWPIPSNACTIKLGTWEQLQVFLTAFDLLNFPPGYEEAIQHNLAMELCPWYDMPVPPTIAALAQDGLSQIQRINAQSFGGSLEASQTLSAPNLSAPPQGPPPQGTGA